MKSDLSHILVVDDDVRLRALLKKYLMQENFLVSTAATLSEAKQALEIFSFDVLIVDIMMPGGRGTDLLKEHKAIPPVLFLSAMGEAEDRIEGLQLGAEDYMVKPFEPKELVLRLQTILRRHKQTVSLGDLEYDKKQRVLWKGGQSFPLTAAEDELLFYFTQRPNELIFRQELLSSLFPDSSNERIVDVQMNRLRKKLGKEAAQHLVSIRGKGYCLREG
jgi:two-component system phosphate regulon response regulator OmpR